MKNKEFRVRSTGQTGQNNLKNVGSTVARSEKYAVDVPHETRNVVNTKKTRNEIRNIINTSYQKLPFGSGGLPR